MYLLGYDIGSSSVKASLVEAETGRCIASDHFPKNEAPIIAKQPGWAEQDPSMWMGNLRLATASVLASAQQVSPKDIKAIGISYQMHGLVCVDREMNVLRPSIIWCDSRAVPYGQKAFDALGEKYCLEHLLNSPGNFTAAKLAWVKENEPDVYRRIWKVMLPESLHSIVLGITLALIALIGASAMAGALGGGGLGDLAIRYGYQRFQMDVMIATVVVLIVMVQGVQSIGNTLSRKLNKNKLS